MNSLYFLTCLSHMAFESCNRRYSSVVGNTCKYIGKFLFDNVMEKFPSATDYQGFQKAVSGAWNIRDDSDGSAIQGYKNPAYDPEDPEDESNIKYHDNIEAIKHNTTPKSATNPVVSTTSGQIPTAVTSNISTPTSTTTSSK